MTKNTWFISEWRVVTCESGLLKTKLTSDELKRVNAKVDDDIEKLWSCKVVIYVRHSSCTEKFTFLGNMCGICVEKLYERKSYATRWFYLYFSYFLSIYSVDIHLISLTKHDFKDIYFTTISLTLINVIRYTTVKINTE